MVEQVERGLKVLISDRFVDSEVFSERDVSRRATEVNVLVKELMRPVWSDKVELTRREAFLALFSWKPKVFKETRVYHACPHLKMDEARKHMDWLFQDLKK